MKELKTKIQKLEKKISNMSMRKAIYTIIVELDEKARFEDYDVSKRMRKVYYGVRQPSNGLEEGRENLDVITDDKQKSIISKYFNDVEILLNELKILKAELKELQPNEVQKSLAKVDSKDFNNYIKTLKNWKEAELVDGKILVNGKEVEAGTRVAVLIGRGKKIHSMKINVRSDEKTNEDVLVIGNDTRWYYSDLLVIDTLDEVPNVIKSKIK